MNVPENDIATQIISDLRAYSSDLLEVGADTAVAARRGTGEGSNASLLRAIQSLTTLLPRLLVELRTAEAPTRYVENVTPVPTGAKLSRRPADYRLRDGRVLPHRWVRMVPLPTLDPRPLRWLLHLLQQQSSLLDEALERTDKRVSEALAARRGRSEWARSDEQNLRHMVETLKQARASLQRSTVIVRRSAGQRPVPTARPPTPYPATQSWVTLRRLAPRLTDPHGFLPEHVSGLLGGPAVTADLPYLYQRWCAIKIVETLDALGWTVREDPVGAIFLGGLITFQHIGGHTVDLWIEPRLQRQARHPSGFRCARGDDVTPDFLFVTPGASGPDAFVLDATLVTSPEDLVGKGRYLTLIELHNFVRIAGCPIKRYPRLSWAAAPLVAHHGKTLRNDGNIGAVPMHPIHWTDAALREWLLEVTRHALAWSLVERVGRD